MPSLNVLIARGDICNCLRSKQMFYEGDILEEDPLHPHPHGPFWCVITQSLIGPDGGLAGDKTCKPGRSCCETA